ncbi:MAG: DNA-3-methyladenine glycosylase [bacterium]|nr:DNA-3-methyladenine glycosylase [bacterium]
MSRAHRLTRSFFDRPTLDICRDILGKYLVYRTPSGRMVGRIVEVEAYRGEDDPACHAAPGQTGRSIYLYAKPGIAYIYLIYGYYFCLNFVTEKEGFPAAVLIRAVEPIEGIELMRERTPGRLSDDKLASGPGRLCRAFGLTLKQNGWDVADRSSMLYLEDWYGEVVEPAVSARVGITKGVDKLWRFYDPASSAVSKGR